MKITIEIDHGHVQYGNIGEVSSFVPMCPPSGPTDREWLEGKIGDIMSCKECIKVLNDPEAMRLVHSSGHKIIFTKVHRTSSHFISCMSIYGPDGSQSLERFCKQVERWRKEQHGR